MVKLHICIRIYTSSAIQIQVLLHHACLTTTYDCGLHFISTTRRLCAQWEKVQQNKKKILTIRYYIIWEATYYNVNMCMQWFCKCFYDMLHWIHIATHTLYNKSVISTLYIYCYVAALHIIFANTTEPIIIAAHM